MTDTEEATYLSKVKLLFYFSITNLHIKLQSTVGMLWLFLILVSEGEINVFSILGLFGVLIWSIILFYPIINCHMNRKI